MLLYSKKESNHALTKDGMSIMLKKIICVECLIGLLAFLFLKPLWAQDTLVLQVKSDLVGAVPATLKPVQFKAKSPLYKKDGVYEGYDLLALLSLKKVNGFKREVVVFEAKDGFKITIPYSYIEKYKPFLATRDTSLPAGQDWEVTRDGGRMIDGGPYYLMWGTAQYNVPENYWAFGVVKIIFSTFKKEFGASAPVNITNSEITRGLAIFQSSCLACHTMNLIGGQLGPEMNVPKNFTEYLKKDFILSYVRSPQSYRASAKMPPQDFLTKDEISSVLSYLEEMKNNKICHNAKECEDVLNKKI